MRVLGPAAAPLALLRGRYRQRLLVIAAPEGDLAALLRAWLKGEKLPGNLRLQEVRPRAPTSGPARSPTA